MRNILIIEDDKDIVELVRYNLEKEGFRVSSAEDGVAGLAQVKKTPPDLIVLDLMLPGVDGLSVCRAVRRDGRRRGGHSRRPCRRPDREGDAGRPTAMPTHEGGNPFG